MKLKIGFTVAAVAALALSSVSATAGSGDKATGGGQTLVGTNGGPGSTIAFTAQQGTGDSTSAKGQVQYIERDNTAVVARGQGDKFHGVVDCLEVDGDFAVIGGYRKGGPSTADRFVLRVVDNAEPNQGQDLIQFDSESEDLRCGDGDAEEPDMEFNLARGNAQVRDGDTTMP